MKYPLSGHSKQLILDAIDTALASTKGYQVEIKLFDNSLKARQRALANIWYKQADEHFGYDTGQTEAYCKYWWGLPMMGAEDPDVEMIVSRMLEGQDDFNSIQIIRTMRHWFPVMRAKGGLSAENQAIYLQTMQRHFAFEGLILSSPREKDLLNCRQANR